MSSNEHGPQGSKVGWEGSRRTSKEVLIQTEGSSEAGETMPLAVVGAEAAQRFAGYMAVTSCLWRIHITPYQHLLYAAHVFLSIKKLFSVSSSASRNSFLLCQ